MSPPASGPERLAAAVLGCALLSAVAFFAVRTREGEEAGFSLPRHGDPHGRTFRSGAQLRSEVDPLRPPGLPAGVGIDPDTGLMTGAELGAGPSEVALPWQRLTAADAVGAAAELPCDILALEGRTVVMAGFLMPLYEVSGIREFLLVASHYACCFGTPPGLGGMAMVRLAPSAPALEPLLAPLRVRGRWKVRERRRDTEPDAPLLLLFEIEDAEAAPLR